MNVRRQVHRPIDSSFEMDVPLIAIPAKGNGKIHLAYELYLTNFALQEMTLTRLEILGCDTVPFAQFEGQELSQLLVRPGLPPSAADKQHIGGGMRAIICLWLTVDSPSVFPAVLRHRVTAKVSTPTIGAGSISSDNQNREIEIKGEGAEMKVRQEAPLILSPPLREGEWLAANGPSNTSRHRHALLLIDGKAHIGQRFAIDWVQLREDGKTWSGDRWKNESYRCYGAEALAVANGVVAAVKNDIPENIPGPTSRAVPITLETIGGNYVTLDLSNDRYAFYAHLQPGSLCVKVGDRVRRGQVLGLVGNSGNSTEPHLHFHISNAKSPLGSEGLPYVFESFEVQGHGWGWKPSSKDAAAETRQMELPLENAIVRFPAVR